MDRNPEVLALINRAKNELASRTEKQREMNENIENTLNLANQNKVHVICKGKRRLTFRSIFGLTFLLICDYVN